MKNQRIFATFIILSFFTNSKIVKEKNKNQTQGRELFFLEAGIFLTNLISGYIYSKYKNQQKVLDWDKDQNWSKRFFHYYQNDSITLKYINLLIDSYGSELMNHCIVIFKIDYEKATKELFQNFLKLNLIKDKELLDYEKDDIKLLKKENKDSYELYKQNLKNYLEMNQVFQKNSGYCYDFFKYIKEHGFITKYIFQADSVLFYYKNSKQYVNMEEEEILSWNIFMDRLIEEFNNEEHFVNFQENHKSYFYTIINFFLNKKSFLKTYLKISGKLK